MNETTIKTKDGIVQLTAKPSPTTPEEIKWKRNEDGSLEWACDSVTLAQPIIKNRVDELETAIKNCIACAGSHVEDWGPRAIDAFKFLQDVIK